ncbi:MAG: DUF4097 family beta strand repeat protein [Clostridia bacterium]|nr:DUF4097 family beta strand repeat protein [Clostridia bacterium]
MDRNEFLQALPVSRISLRLISATLEICTDDIDDIHVMVAGDDHAVNALRIVSSADHLTIEQPAAALAKSAASSIWMQLTLRLPRSWKGSIEARTVTGRINARGLSGADLSLDTVSGRIVGTALSFITVSARSVTGEVKLSGMSCDKCSLSSTSGSVTAQETSLRSCTANTVTGVIALALTEPFDEINMNSVAGDLCIDAPIDACDALLRSVSGRMRTSGVSIIEGTARVRATTVSSDLDISRSDLVE